MTGKFNPERWAAEQAAHCCADSGDTVRIEVRAHDGGGGGTAVDLFLQIGYILGMSNTRTDIHRPAEMVASDYECWGTYQLPIGSDEEVYEDTEVLEGATNEVNDTSTPYAWGVTADNGQRRDQNGDMMKCDHCGARHKAGAVFEHTPTKQLIAVGRDCAESMSLAASWGKVDALQKNAAEARKRVRIRRMSWANLREWLKGMDKDLRKDLAAARGNYIVKDIKGRAIRYARKGWEMKQPSEKQAALIRKLGAEARKPKVEETYVAAPVTDKRQLIRGEVVSVRYNEEWGVTNMTIKVTTEDGVWLCWGTRPRSWENFRNGCDYHGELKGCTVEFMARLQPGKDSHFAFLKRPTKAKVVKGGPAQKDALKTLQEMPEDQRAWIHEYTGANIQQRLEELVG